VVWAHCGLGTTSTVLRSTNRGRSFQSAAPGMGQQIPKTAAFGAASANVAVVAGVRIYRTANRGVSYARRTERA
jgi:hypothetical protein